MESPWQNKAARWRNRASRSRDGLKTWKNPGSRWSCGIARWKNGASRWKGGFPQWREMVSRWGEIVSHSPPISGDGARPTCRKRQSRLTSIRTTPSGGARGCGAEIVAGVVGASLRVYQSGRLASCESPRIDSRAFYSLEVNEGSDQPDSVYNNSRKGAKAQSFKNPENENPFLPFASLRLCARNSSTSPSSPTTGVKRRQV